MKTKLYAKLNTPLFGYEEPNTQMYSHGKLPEGTYYVKEVKLNYPDESTDYAHLSVPFYGDGDTWICVRWKQNRYATLFEKASKKPKGLDFSEDPMAIDEHHLVDMLPKFHDFSYDLDEARYPFPITGFRAPQAPPFTNNCCTMVEALVVGGWEQAIPMFKWNQTNHGQMMIFSADDYFSPVSCLVNEDMAVPVEDHDAEPHPWTVIQGWRRQWTSGHTFIILDHHIPSDRVLTLESNAAYRLNGVGYRMIGNLKDYPEPPKDWWKNDQLWTWERIKSVYRFRKQCVLKVKNRSWNPAEGGETPSQSKQKTKNAA